jgi:hemoglobin
MLAVRLLPWLLCGLLASACAEVGTADPPTPPAAPEPPTLVITSPAEGASVTLQADAPRTLVVAFDLTGFVLRVPGTCLASEHPCGHVVVHVDGDACNAEGADFNVAGAGSPVGAAMVHCADSAGPHQIELHLAADDRTPWEDGSGAGITASISVTTEVPSLYDRLGGAQRIAGLLDATFALHVLTDPRVNAYFHNDTLDLDSLKACLADQIGEAAGGPEVYSCRSMAEAHAGLGISPLDFADFAADFEEAALYGGLGPADVAELLALLEATESDIVEDVGADNTLYQRLGRRPGIDTLVAEVIEAVLVDLELSSFFVQEGETGPSYSARLPVCLTRLICAIDGPCEYGTGTEPELEGLACLNLRDAHVDRTDTEGLAIALFHYLRFTELLVEELDAAGVAPLDQELLVGAFVPICCDIVRDNSACEAFFDELEVDLACEDAR